MADETKATETVAKSENEAQVATETVNEWKDGEKYDAEKAKELIAKLRGEAKDKKALEKRLAEYEAAEQKRKDAELSEVEKAQKRAERAEAEASELKRKDLQRTAADKTGLPAQLAERLRGETLEELEADAKGLLELMPKPSGKTNVTNPGNQPVSETDAERGRRLGLRK